MLFLQHIGNAPVTLIRLVPMTVWSLVTSKPRFTNDEQMQSVGAAMVALTISQPKEKKKRRKSHLLLRAEDVRL
jgi:hypothetical protein